LSWILGARLIAHAIIRKCMRWEIAKLYLDIFALSNRYKNEMIVRQRLQSRIFSQSALVAAAIAPFLLCASTSSSLLAQSETQNVASQDTPAQRGNRPASAGRVVRAFDFEEQEYNPLPVPLGWIRAQEDPDVPRIRPGFPIWNGAKLDYQSPAYSGIGSVMLPTKGGSTSLVLRHGEINVFPNADYLVSARIKTAGLKHAKARVVAKLIDQQGAEIPGAKVATMPVHSENEWTQVSLEIEGVYQNAAYMKVELQLLQPKQQYEERASRAFAVWEQDYQGAAWFDNLIIAQLPRLDITTGEPGNIVASQTPPPLKVLVRDLTGDAIIARARIYNVHGQEVDSKLLADGSRRVRKDWTPNLPGFGWYRAQLEVVVDKQLVGIRTLDFIWSSPKAQMSGSGDGSIVSTDQSSSQVFDPSANFSSAAVTEKTNSGMFAIHADLTDERIANSALALVTGTGLSRASLEVWNNQTVLEDFQDGAPTLKAIDELINAGTSLRIEFSEIPNDLAQALAVDSDEVLPVFAGPLNSWAPWAAGLLDEYGQSVSHWRFGKNPTQESSSTINPQLDNIHRSLIGYVPGPVLVTPWSIDRLLQGELIRPNHQLLILDNDTTSEDSMGLIVDDWIQATQSSSAQASSPKDNSSRPPALAMMMSPNHHSSDWSGVDVWSSLGGFARKAISFWWAAGISGMDASQFTLELQDAWWVSPGKRGQVMPAPELVVWRTLATLLGGRQAVEELDLIPSVRMLVASPREGEDQEKGGALVIWRDEPGINPISIKLPLATGEVIIHDVFNNQQTVPLSYDGDLSVPMHRIEVGRSPLIITGVNANLIRFLSALSITPDKLQAQSGIHEHAISIVNPWPINIAGRLFIVEPGGFTGPASDIDRSWEITPRVIPFVLDPYEERMIPVEIAYSLGEIAGMKKLTFDVELEADQDYPILRVERSIELGLDSVEMNLSARRRADGVTIVAALVTNKHDQNQDFEVIAIAANESRLRRSINTIKPDQQVLREFAFSKAKPGDEVIISLILRDTSTRLNKSVIVP
jgi:hypothetical protein